MFVTTTESSGAEEKILFVSQRVSRSELATLFELTAHKNLPQNKTAYPWTAVTEQ